MKAEDRGEVRVKLEASAAARAAARENATRASRGIAAEAVAAITGNRRGGGTQRKRSNSTDSPQEKEKKKQQEAEAERSLAGLPSHLQQAIREDQRMASVVRVFPSQPREKPYYNLSGLSDSPVETGPAADQWMMQLLRAPSSTPQPQVSLTPAQLEEEKESKREQVREAIRKANLARLFERLKRTMRKKRDEEEAKIESLDKKKEETKTTRSSLQSKNNNNNNDKKADATANSSSTPPQLSKQSKPTATPSPPPSVTPASTNAPSSSSLLSPPPLLPPVLTFAEKAEDNERKRGGGKPTDAREVVRQEVRRVLKKKFPASPDPLLVEELAFTKVWNEWSRKTRPVSASSWLGTDKIRKWVVDSVAREVKKRSAKHA